MKSIYKVFATFNDGKVRLYKNFILLPNSYISVNGNEPTPIEDYGEWALFEEDVTEEQALERYISLRKTINQLEDVKKLKL